MLGNYLSTALRNLGRNWLYAAISIFGLAVSFAGAILVAQFVRNEFSYDRWIPGYSQIYKITLTKEPPGQAPVLGDFVHGSLKKELKEKFAGTVASARMMPFDVVVHQSPDPGGGGILDHTLVWADPDVFKVFPLPAVAGDPATALDQADTVVITQSVARKYFGREDVIGDTLNFDQPLTSFTPNGTREILRPYARKVTAVLKDFPSSTMLDKQIFATGGFLAMFDGRPGPLTGNTGRTFVRVKPETTPQQLQAALDEIGKPTREAFASLGGTKASFGYVPLAEIHLTPSGAASTPGSKPVGDRATAIAFATVAGLIVLIAAINFVTLMTARASRRALEVGVRKAVGARRSDLVIQFMGEALVQAFLSMLIAVGIAGLLARPFGDFVQRDIALDFLGDPALTLGLLAATFFTGILGGFYPALVLSSFRPGAVLKGGKVRAAGSPATRQMLVVAQFAILIGLIISTVTIYQQTQLALSIGLGRDSDRIIQIRTGCHNTAFMQELRKAPGVERVGCSGPNALSLAKNIFPTNVPTRDGQMISFDTGPVQFGFFETYDIKPLAGRVFESARGLADNPPFQEAPPPQPGPDGRFGAARPVVLNQTAVKMLGYSSPQDAIGKQLVWNQPNAGPGPLPSDIIGVVPDLPVSVNDLTGPMIYIALDGRMAFASARLTEDANLPQTLSEIERAWKATNNVVPLQVTFYSDYVRNQYLDFIIQATLLAICAIAAIVIACLGLFALSAFAAERRTKEIGIRKALGATTSHVLGLLMWQFTLPVLVAIAIALPASYLLMANWLQGFAYRIDLSPWTFAIAAGVALAVAWLTVFVQTVLVASARPVRALRYE